jgi:hypothetical protein
MKIKISDIKTTPKNMGFNFCVWGDPNQKVSDWISHWGLESEKSGGFTNILIGDQNLYDLFESPKVYEFVDGFSPNLNKHLHLGHLSNLIFAKSIQSLGIGEKYIAILGDTLSGKVDQDDALDKFKSHCESFGYKIDSIHFASGQKLVNTSILEDGVGEYKGTLVFDVNGSKIVGIKSDGSSSYFYQDVTLAQKLDGSTLYITGFEQDNHFKSLKSLFPDIDHIGLGLVMVDGKKMSSSEGNVIMMDDILDQVSSKFDGDKKLAWNVISGHILKYSPESVKNIDLKSIDDVKSSWGLYLSYTLAKMKSAGMLPNDISDFTSNQLKYAFLQAKTEKSPHYLFNSLVDHCKKISQMYTKLYIKDNFDNQKVYQPLLNDLLLGMKKLGMFDIDKV